MNTLNLEPAILGFIIFVCFCVILTLVLVNYNEQKEKRQKPSLPGHLIGFEDYVFIDYWEVRYFEPISEN